jgi:AcrR family transcriptional regulator
MTTRAERPDRGEAIMAAALEVFGRDGFTDGNVEEIARVAHVAKPTVYNRFADKRGLFVAAVNRGVERAATRMLDAIRVFDPRADDLRGELEQLGRALVACVAHAEGAAVIRLQLTEGARFPELIDSSRNHNQMLDALAGKLAQLAAGGRLQITDPQRAARQFSALVADDALVRGGFGAVVLEASDVDRSVREGVDTFLAAFS